jgi:hypothetical protein
MFEELRLLGPTERNIVVQTRKGTSIENVIEAEPGEPEQRRYQLLLKRIGQNWRERKPAAGVYNCAGHVWASRRTSILADDAWRTILQEDGYRRLSDTESPVAGDLVIYRDSTNQSFNHVGAILELCEGVALGSPRVPRVLSKWNSTSGEVIHLSRDVPYDLQSVTIEYWTDCPAR